MILKTPLDRAQLVAGLVKHWPKIDDKSVKVEMYSLVIYFLF